MALIRGEQITGSVASANLATTASYALTASYTLGSGTPYLIQSGSVSAEVDVTGNLFLIKSASTDFVTITSNTTTINTDVFIIKNLSDNEVLKVSESVLYLSTQSSALSDSVAAAGALYFTSSSFFVGLDD